MGENQTNAIIFEGQTSMSEKHASAMLSLVGQKRAGENETSDVIQIYVYILSTIFIDKLRVFSI